MCQVIGCHCPGGVRTSEAEAIVDDELMRPGRVKGHAKGYSTHRWEGGWTAQAPIAMDVIHINQVGILLSDQQKLAGGVNQYLGGSGMGSGKGSGTKRWIGL